jgi:RHS repeat-associated protein
VSWTLPLHQFQNVVWTITGGDATFADQNNSSCHISSSTSSLTETITVTETVTGQSAQLNVVVSGPYLVMSGPFSVDQGTTAQPLVGTLEVDGFTTVTNIQWQKSSDAFNWSVVQITDNPRPSLETAPYIISSYVPSSDAGAYYRFVANIAGTIYATNPVFITVMVPTPGTISIVQQPAYNGEAVVSTTDAYINSSCSTLDYIWEESIDGQPWTVFGSGSAYPSGNHIVGLTSIRRKATCSGIILISNVLSFNPPYTSVDHENLNYIRTIDVHISGVSTWAQADQLPMTDKTQTTVYIDGVGRPIQKVAKSASYYNGAWADLVQPIVYDVAGRQTQSYMPYPTTDVPGKFKSANVMTAQASFVTTKFGESSDAPTYSRTEFDESPLDRIKHTFAPGKSWGGSSVGTTTDYDFNTADENVHIWDLDYSPSALPATSLASVYTTGSLFKLTFTDEKGLRVIHYTDLFGKTILKKVQQADPGTLSGQHSGWACTYYVYDDLNQLRFTIPAKAIEYLDNNGWSLSQQIVNDLCFVYSYDAKGRMISKKQPGVEESNYVYDQRDRPVFTQDANGKLHNQWQGTIYDGLGRATSTGVVNAAMDRQSLQNYVDGNTGNVILSRITTFPGLADLPVGGLQNGVTQYVASRSITFENFTSDDNGHFTAYIDNNLGNRIDEIWALQDNTIPVPGSFIPLTQTFYDDYSHATKAYSTADNTLFDAATNQQAKPLPGQYNPQTRGLVTTTRVKIVSNSSDLTQGNWMEKDVYYDEQVQQIQAVGDNSLGGVDVVTNRYDFAGKLWGSCVKHMAGIANQFTIVSKNSYDAVGQLIDVARNFNSTYFKDLVAYSYDEYGKLSSKRLAPGYTGSGRSEMETLAYAYNIQGRLTGINKDYALDQDAAHQWDRFFGLYLGYDNRDNQFAAAQYNGNITGAIWKSQGDNSMRKYDYSYDNLGRLTSAVFNQRKTPGDGWSNGEVDLSEYITYKDGNGNISTMKRMGIVPGINTGILIDNLQYSYGTSSNPYSNKLTRVDESAGFSGNGQLSDFKDGTNSGMDDYTYDNAGNLIQDLNKGIAAGGIEYNYRNKPVKITIAGKSIVQYTYDGSGVKLKKMVTNLAVTPNTTSVTDYEGDFVYQDNTLQYVLHEEGRMKVITPVNTAQLQLNGGSGGATVLSGKTGVFEYFVKDQLSNVRMVLTEEYQKETYVATMETISGGDPNLGVDEAKLFGKVDPATGAPTADNELILTRVNKPVTWSGNSSNKVAALTASNPNSKVGPNMILKVSAGDMINAGVKYFYFTNDPSGSSDGVSDALTSLVGSMLSGNVSSITKMNSSLISSNLGASGSNFSNFITGLPNQGNVNAPKAFLNIVFFDEQFNFIPGNQTDPQVGTSASRVSSANDQNANLLLQQKAPKNGWVYIYLTNQSNEEVDFDDLSVSQVHGRISEETHYYAFGQKIAGISTVAFNKLTSKHHYRADYSEEEENTGWNEFDLRMYDPQLGRWTGADPYDEFASPYIGFANDPVNNIDEDGGGVGDVIGAVTGGIVGGTIAYLAAKNNKASGFWAVMAGIGGTLVGSDLGYGIVASLEGNGPVWLNMRAYLKGFFGGHGFVYARYDAMNRIWNQVDVPNVWKWVSSLYNLAANLNFSFARKIATTVEEEFPELPRTIVGQIVDMHIGGDPGNKPPPPEYDFDINVPLTTPRRVPFNKNSTISGDLSIGSFDLNISEDELTFTNTTISGIRSRVSELGGGTLTIQNITVTMQVPPNFNTGASPAFGGVNTGVHGLPVVGDTKAPIVGNRPVITTGTGIGNLRQQGQTIGDRINSATGGGGAVNVQTPIGNGFRISTSIRGILTQFRTMMMRMRITNKNLY